MKREIPTITISCGKNDMFMNPPCNFRPNVSTSTSYFSGVSIREINIPDTSAPSRKEFLDSLTQLQPYVGRDFVPYTISSQPFVEPYVPHVLPNPSEVTKKTDPVILNKKYIDKSVTLRKSGDYENALKSCDEALKADPKYLDGWNEKAAIFIDKAEYKRAIEYCDIAIIIDPKYFYAYNNKAIALRKLEDYENALKSCDEALKINPGYSDARNEKNNILNGFYLQISTLITKKQYEKAIKDCDTIINSDDKNIYAYHKKVIALRMLEDYENALKNCDKSILYMENIDNYGIGKVEDLNKLYLQRKKQHIEAAAKRDYFYNQSVINGVNGFDWYQANPSRDFYSFFRNTLKVSDKTPDNVKLIKDRLYKNLPPYLEQARKSNYFLDEYNKYYKDMVASKEKLGQIIDIYNIKAIASKKLGDYESALKSCDIAIKINPKDLEASNFKKFILKEKADFEKAIEYSDNMLRIKPSYHMNNFDYFLKLPYLHQVSVINLSNNQIGDSGAKVLADSLSKGQMPNLKKLHLEGNKITEKGETALIKTMKGQVQDIVVLTNKINMTDKIISGTKEERIAIYKDLIEKGKAKGTYDGGLVIDRSFLGEIKNLANISKVTFQAAIGFAKCHFSPDDVAVGYAQDSIIAKLPNMLSKTAQYFTKIMNVKNIGECYVYVTEDGWTSEVGQQVVKHDLCLAGETEFCGD